MAKIKLKDVVDDPAISGIDDDLPPEPQKVQPADSSVTCPECITEFDPGTGDIIKLRADDEPPDSAEAEPDDAPPDDAPPEPAPEESEDYICPPLMKRSREVEVADGES